MRHLSRIGNLTVVVTILTLIAPTMILIALLIKLDGGPILVRSNHPSCNDRAYTGWKFRITGIGEGANRLTPIGRRLHALALDDLPLLFGILGAGGSIPDLNT